MEKSMAERRRNETGSMNNPSRCLVLDGDKFKVRNNEYETRAGGCGFGLTDKEVMYTLNTVDRHIVAVIRGA